MKLSQEDLNEIEHDRLMLDRISKYEITDKNLKAINHLVTKVIPGKRDEFTKNYIHGLIAAAVMDYENKYVRGRYDITTWFTDW